MNLPEGGSKCKKKDGACVLHFFAVLLVIIEFVARLRVFADNHYSEWIRENYELKRGWRSGDQIC